MTAKETAIKVGQRVALGGFSPMSTMEKWEGFKGTVTSMGDKTPMGQPVTIKLDSGGGEVSTRAQFCKPIEGDSE